jgi:hypothetical protein
MLRLDVRWSAETLGCVRQGREACGQPLEDEE